jgi:hypothetical protein
MGGGRTTVFHDILPVGPADMRQPLARAYTINAPDIVAEDFDGQVVVLNLANGHYYSVQGAGGLLWTLVAGGHPVAEVLASLSARRPELSDAAAHFLEQLVALQLIRENPSPADGSAGLTADWPAEAPRLDVFEDLAELITADPVHDVDVEAGWPILRQQA